MVSNPPGADVMELTRRTIASATRKRPGWTGPYLDLDMDDIARAIQQYGDERAAAAIEAVAVAMDTYHGTKTAEYVRSLKP